MLCPHCHRSSMLRPCHRQALQSFRVQAWPPVIAEVNNFQKACTGGRLTYQSPVVTPYIDIPCTPMPTGNRLGFQGREACRGRESCPPMNAYGK